MSNLVTFVGVFFLKKMKETWSSISDTSGDTTRVIQLYFRANMYAGSW